MGETTGRNKLQSVWERRGPWGCRWHQEHCSEQDRWSVNWGWGSSSSGRTWTWWLASKQTTLASWKLCPLSWAYNDSNTLATCGTHLPDLPTGVRLRTSFCCLHSCISCVNVKDGLPSTSLYSETQCWKVQTHQFVKFRSILWRREAHPFTVRAPHICSSDHFHLFLLESKCVLSWWEPTFLLTEPR